MRTERIPLFPRNVVLLPGAELPLQIFEPRYRETVKRCLKEKSEFGMLLSIPKGVAQIANGKAHSQDWLCHAVPRISSAECLEFSAETP